MSDLIEKADSLLLPTVQHVQLAATNAIEMELSKSRTLEWFLARLKQAEEELKLAQQSFSAAEHHGFRLAPFKSAITNMQKTVDFYRKAVLASEAGYTVFPELPLNVFAVRTKRKYPDRQMGDRWKFRESGAQYLPPGQGAYVDNLPLVDWHHSVTKKRRDGSEYEENIWYACGFADEIDFPDSVRHPQVIDAVGAAMDMMLFDEIGVLPARRANGDPVVIGQIRRKKHARPLPFLIAWYIDSRAI